MIHHGKDVTLQLDSRWHAKLEATGNRHHLHLDPEMYIGAAPKHAKGIYYSHKKSYVRGSVKLMFFLVTCLNILSAHYHNMKYFMFDISVIELL